MNSNKKSTVAGFNFFRESCFYIDRTRTGIQLITQYKEEGRGPGEAGVAVGKGSALQGGTGDFP